jgi:hypothetical protein
MSHPRAIALDDRGRAPALLRLVESLLLGLIDALPNRPAGWRRPRR